MKSLETDRKYREEKKQKFLSDKVKVKIEKGKLLNAKKVEKIIAYKNNEKHKVSSGENVPIGEKKHKKGILVRKRINTGEKELFFRIRMQRKHICILCKKHIQEAQARCFAHLLGKGMYPKYRLCDNNIAIVCGPHCHKAIDSIIVGENKTAVKDMIDNGCDIYYIMQALGVK